MSEQITLEPLNIELISNIQPLILEKLHKFQTFKNFFDETEAQRNVKIDEILGEIKSIGGNATNEDHRNIFNSHKPKALYKFKQNITTLEARYLLSSPAEQTDDYRVDTNYLEVGIADIKPLELQELIHRFHFCMPLDLNIKEVFPSSYIFKFETGVRNPINQTIKDLWNFCLALKGEDHRIGVLTKEFLQEGEYITPFFTIRIKKTTQADEFFDSEYKVRITWNEEITALLEQNKSFMVQTHDEDDF